MNIRPAAINDTNTANKLAGWKLSKPGRIINNMATRPSATAIHRVEFTRSRNTRIDTTINITGSPPASAAVSARGTYLIAVAKHTLAPKKNNDLHTTSLGLAVTKTCDP